MKKVEMTRDYVFRVNGRAFIKYEEGQTYRRVPEVQVRAILKAGAGKIADE